MNMVTPETIIEMSAREKIAAILEITEELVKIGYDRRDAEKILERVSLVGRTPGRSKDLLVERISGGVFMRIGIHKYAEIKDSPHGPSIMVMDGSFGRYLQYTTLKDAVMYVGNMTRTQT